MIEIDASRQERWFVRMFGRVRNAARLRREREARGLATAEGDEALVGAMVAEAGIEAVIARLSTDGGFVARAPDGRRFVVSGGEPRRTLGWNLESGLLRVGDPGDVAAAVGRERDPAALWLWLAMGAVPPPLTAFRRVTALAAGHVLAVDPRPTVTAWREVRPPTSGREGRADVWALALDRALRVAVAQRLPVNGVIVASDLDARLAVIARDKGEAPACSPPTRLHLDDGFAAFPAPDGERLMWALGGMERFLTPRDGWIARIRRHFRKDVTGLGQPLVDEALHALRVNSVAEATDPRTVWRLPLGPRSWADTAEGPLGTDVLARWALAPARLAGLQRVDVALPLMAPELDDRLADIPMGLRRQVTRGVFGAATPASPEASMQVAPIPGITRGGRLTARWETVRLALEAGTVT